MPIYEYRCRECAQIFEEWQKDFKEREVPCPVCGNSSDRLISNTSFVLKGGGWYVTDYADKKNIVPENKPKSDDNGNGNGNGNGSSAKPAETKPAAPACAGCASSSTSASS
ncbi:FmdB family zinc ribbon protein [Desulfovibrio inopinatus]|uniref:FmdB family zinc ribbon protein n=1 Tax=Desulfovibrio inopinatus TaxID=102109 RepID=UPI00042A3944|nr:zinc ribbon domain-containing protein [Desulfovibrio inopinatus]